MGGDEAEVAEPTLVEIVPVPFSPPTRSWDLSVPAPCFYDHREAFPYLQAAIMPYFDGILAEMKANLFPLCSKL